MGPAMREPVERGDKVMRALADRGLPIIAALILFFSLLYVLSLHHPRWSHVLVAVTIGAVFFGAMAIDGMTAEYVKRLLPADDRPRISELRQRYQADRSHPKGNTRGAPQ